VNVTVYVCHGTIHIAGTDRGHTQSVCAGIYVRQATKAQLNRMMERFMFYSGFGGPFAALYTICLW